MKKGTIEALFALVKTGLGVSKETQVLGAVGGGVDWQELLNQTKKQGVSAICLDGLGHLSDSLPKDPVMEYCKLQWIGELMYMEQNHQQQMEAATQLAEAYHDAGLRIFVLKGFSVGMLYPQPNHRPCGDLDCFLRYASDDTSVCVSAFEQGNLVAEEQGVEVDRFYYVHSKFNYMDMTVENHQHLMPIKGSKKDKQYEQLLLSLLESDEPRYVNGTWMETPSPMFQALFILSHAQGHFMNEKITLRHVCDWAMVLNAYREDVDWAEWKSICKKYDLLKFGYALTRLAEKVCGVEPPFECLMDKEKENALMNDILTPECIIDGNSRMVRHYQIIRNIFRSSWKFKMFSHSSSMMYIWKRVRGCLFEKEED